MKHLLLTTIAAVLVVGCATTQQPKPPTAKAPDISIHDAAGAGGRKGNIEAVKQYLAAGTDVDARDAEDKTPLQHADVNARDDGGLTPLHFAAREGGHKEIDYKDICINLAIDPDEEIVLDEPAEDLTCLSVFDLLNGRLMELA
jgi:ankyrin repeat protein